MPIIKKIIIKKQDYTFTGDNSLEMDALNFKRSITILESIGQITQSRLRFSPIEKGLNRGILNCDEMINIGR